MTSVLPIRCRTYGFLLTAVVSVLVIGPATAQKKQPGQQPGDTLESLSKPGPLTANLGTVAQLEVPAGYVFVPKENLAQFKKLTGNLYSPLELGAIVPTNGDNWWVVFSYHDEGYIKDDEKDKLDANAIFKDLQEVQEEGNKNRKQQGMKPLTLVGWAKAPYYDPKTNNLTSGLKLSAEGEPGVSINHEARTLGRGGYMSATLIVGEEDYAASVPGFDKLLTQYSYTSGNKYSEWQAGDKVAAYGLAGLVAGGALAVAAKSGLLGKLLKPIIAGIVLLGGVIAKYFRRIFGMGKASTPSADEPSASPDGPS